MIGPHTFSVEPWCVCESELDLESAGQTESIFALSNGHIGLRGTSMRASPPGHRART